MPCRVAPTVMLPIAPCRWRALQTPHQQLPPQQGHSCLWGTAQSYFLPAWNCGLTSPHSLTCSPSGVLCHMIPAQHIPAQQDMA